MKLVRRHMLTTALAVLALIGSPAVFAQAYPAKPITVVVAYPPGGDTDAIARLFAEKLSQRLKQTVIVDNKPGAGGVVGNSLVGRAPADGYTLLFTPNPFTTAPMVMKLAPAASYDVLGGFEPIAKTAIQPLVLVANPGVGIKSIPDMIAMAKSGKSLSYASPGAGSPMHILGEWLNASAGVKITHVPYRGVGPSVVDVVAGHVNTAWVTLGAVSQYTSNGRLIPLVVGDAQRSALAPNLPTLVELGYKDVVVGAWNGFFAPKGTPADVVKLLNGHLNEILKQQDVIDKLAVFGAQPAGGRPTCLARPTRPNTKSWARSSVTSALLRNSRPAMSQSTLGRDVPQVNARSKVLGRAQYAGDIKVAGMLHGKVLRSPYPHARIVSIDTSAARALPGVKAVVTGVDGPRTLWGVHHKERRILAEGVVRFAGEEVAAVAALTEEIARDALDLIQVEYAELPAILTPEEALDPQAPGVHEGRDNVAHDIRFERGDVNVAFASAHLVHEATYTTHAQYPGYMEPMASVAMIDADGRLQVWTSTQSAFLVRARLASVLEMPVSQIRVIQATTGGGFGGKMIEDANNLIAARLALATGKPVRLVNNRLEDFLACASSVPERITLKLGMDRDGLIVAKDVRIIAECGAYSGLSAEVMHVSAMRSDNMHRQQHVRSHATLVYTHTPPHGAFRGFGGTQMQFALNSHIDTMARMLGLDVVGVHKRNAIGAGETSVHGWKVGSTGLKECIDQCIEAIGWTGKRARSGQTGAKRCGVGMGAVMHVSGNRTIGNWDGSSVMLKINEDGRVVVHSGEADAGQGAMTMLAQVVAHELDIPMAHVHVAIPDTDAAPWCIGALASRVTIAGGNAAIVASRLARDKLFALAADMLERTADQLELTDGVVRVRAEPSRKHTLAELARTHIWRHGGEGIQVVGSWDSQTVMHDATVYGNVAPAYSFAAQALEVEVDIETGQVTVVDSYVADDCGKAFNPQAVHGQSNGAAAQAIGWALYEQLQLEGGRMMNGNFADYTMPTADALPMLQSGIVESNDPNGPYGAKGASETAILPGAPAIANAVFDAVGVRITDLPITPEKVLAALRAQKLGTQERAGASHA